MAYDPYNQQRQTSFSFFPPVIKNLLIINGVVFFLTILAENMKIGGVPASAAISRYFALWPLQTGYFQIWQLITFQFLHAGFSHIFFNLFALWMFGAEIENLIGSKKFLIYYLACGIGAGLLHIGLNPLISETLGGPLVGASGGVYGIMIAFAMLFPDRYLYLYFLIPVKAKYFIAFLIALEFLMVNSGSGGQIAHLAHLGGALVGFIFVLADKAFNAPIKAMFSNSRSRASAFKPNSQNTNRPANQPPPSNSSQIEDAVYYDIKDQESFSQDDIDRILDKISQSGYKNLTEREKRILFEASKRMK